MVVVAGDIQWQMEVAIVVIQATPAAFLIMVCCHTNSWRILLGLTAKEVLAGLREGLVLTALSMV
jgi:hypothetical protein